MAPRSSAPGAAAWAPVERLRGVVVLDAHDEAYREERAPTWSAVDVVVERARRDGAPVVLVSSCPPVSLTEGARLVTTERALERRGGPWWRSSTAPPTTRGRALLQRLARLLHAGLERPDGRVVCVLNRTGRIRLMACVLCGSLARCTRCGGAMAQPAVGAALECRRCGDTRPAVCADCDSTRLRSLRIGVTRATEELSALTGVEAMEITGNSAPEVPARCPAGGRHRGCAAPDRAGPTPWPSWSSTSICWPPLHRRGAVARPAGPGGSPGRDPGPGGRRAGPDPGRRDTRSSRRPLAADPGLLAGPERALRRQLDLPPFGALAQLRGPGGAELAACLERIPGIATSSIEPDRWLGPSVRAPHALRRTGRGGRPAERVRVEVDPVDV